MARNIPHIRQIPNRTPHNGTVLQKRPFHVALRQPASPRNTRNSRRPNHPNILSIQTLLLPLPRQHFSRRIRQRTHLHQRPFRHAAGVHRADVSNSTGRKRPAKPPRHGRRFFPTVRAVHPEGAPAVSAVLGAAAHPPVRPDVVLSGAPRGEHLGDEVFLRSDRGRAVGSEGEERPDEEDFGGVRTAVGEEFGARVRVLPAQLHAERGGGCHRGTDEVGQGHDGGIFEERIGGFAEAGERGCDYGYAATVERYSCINFKVSFLVLYSVFTILGLKFNYY